MAIWAQIGSKLLLENNESKHTCCAQICVLSDAQKTSAEVFYFDGEITAFSKTMLLRGIRFVIILFFTISTALNIAR